jgi:hypothetical protein
MESKVAALYCNGRLVTGRSHLDAWEQLSEEEKEGQITSGFFDLDSKEFMSDLEICDEKEDSNEVHNNDRP